MIRHENRDNAIIFCNRKKDVDILTKSLKNHEFKAVALHGDMSQPARLETLEKFKSEEVNLLIASDVAARGLDIPKVSHVFNFDVPNHAEDYVHRIGRTGRAGKEGKALTITTPDDRKFLTAVYEFIGKTIEEVAPNELDLTDLNVQSGTTEVDNRKKSRSRGKKARSSSSSKFSRTTKTQKSSEESIVGMGDHTPAFLLRPSKMATAN